MTTTTLTPGRHNPTRQPACDIERAFGEHNDDGVHVCTDGPGHFVLGRPHACSCGYSWPAHGQVPADSTSERIARWRTIADLDSRAGAPVGNALRDACDELERLRAERQRAIDALSEYGRNAIAVSGDLEDGINADHLNTSAELDGLAAEVEARAEENAALRDLVDRALSIRAHGETSHARYTWRSWDRDAEAAIRATIITEETGQ